MNSGSPRRWPALLACLFAGMGASMALPPFGVVPMIALLSWPVLVIAGASGLRAAGLAAGVTGFGWFLASLWWISLSLVTGDTNYWPLLPVPLIGIPLLLALFWVPAAVIAHRIGRTPAGRAGWLLLGLAAAEWARGHVATGFPWNAPGYLFSAHLTLLQSASVFGLYGLTLLALAAGFAPAFWILGQRRLAICLVAVLPVLALVGGLRLATMPSPSPDVPKLVRLVQPAVPQHEKWDRGLRPGHLQRLQQLSRGQVPVPQLVIWPETAFAGLLDREPELLKAAAWESLPFDGWLITGVPRFDGQRRLFNSAALMRADGQIEALYDKRRLVPFGEFVPFRPFVPFADAVVGPIDFSRGSGDRLFTLPHYGKLQLLICYETLFPGVAAGPGPRPDILVNLTNDAWFGDTPGPWQHLAQARMRAVEEGLPMLRVANTGISAAFGPKGRMLASIGLGQTGFADIEVPAPLPPTIYARWREGLFLGLLLMLMLVNIGLDRSRPMGHQGELSAD